MACLALAPPELLMPRFAPRPVAGPVGAPARPAAAAAPAVAQVSAAPPASIPARRTSIGVSPRSQQDQVWVRVLQQALRSPLATLVVVRDHAALAWGVRSLDCRDPPLR
eukprot:6231796-Pyramimonas_sp.AAC.1